VPERSRSPLVWFTRGGWYVFVDVGSLGLLTWVPPLHAALRTGRAIMWLWTVLYVLAVTGALVTPSSTFRGGLIMVLIIVSVVHSLVLRRQVWDGSPRAVRTTPPPPALRGADPAVAAVLAARARRDEARRIAATDPRMARELRIGRPDLRRGYDDGGLVDLNAAPAAAIAALCDIDPESAQRIVAAREAGVPFTTIDDVFSTVDVPYPLWDRIRDRGVVVP
jgi:Helix-hairpin-helix motif